MTRYMKCYQKILRQGQKKKCWLNLLSFGCHLLQNASKAMWKSFFLMLLSTPCDSLWISFSIWETKQNHRGGGYVQRVGRMVNDNHVVVSHRLWFSGMCGRPLFQQWIYWASHKTRRCWGASFVSCCLLSSSGLYFCTIVLLFGWSCFCLSLLVCGQGFIYLVGQKNFSRGEPFAQFFTFGPAAGWVHLFGFISVPLFYYLGRVVS
jgi:hypothetical protein